MDRNQSLRVLGLPASADDREIQSVYWSLRAHVETRSLAAASPEERVARDSELAELERMLAVLAPAKLRTASRLTIGLVAWGCLATGTALVLGVLLLRSGAPVPRVLVAGEGGGGSGSDGIAFGGVGDEAEGAEGAASEIVDGGERARVVVHAEVADAALEIEDASDGSSVAAGPADERTWWVASGDYVLRVSHPDCREAWEQTLAAAAGGEYEFAPEICADTGWLIVQSNVDGARLEVDGQSVGGTGEGRHPLPAGEHEIRVEKDGYQPWEGLIELVAAQEMKLKPRLIRVAGKPKEPRKQEEREQTAEAEGQEQEQRVAAASAQAATAASASGGPRPARAGELRAPAPDLDSGWHHETRQWILARYDFDQSGNIDSVEELEAVPCDYWLSIERSYDASGLGVSLIRVYGFDGNGWKEDALGVGSEVRDLAFARMRSCGLRY